MSLGIDELGVFCEEDKCPPRLLYRKTGAGTTDVCCMGSNPV